MILSSRILRLESAVLKPLAAGLLLCGCLALLNLGFLIGITSLLAWYSVCHAGRTLDRVHGTLAYAFRLRSNGKGFLAIDSGISHEESYAIANVVVRVALVIGVSLAVLTYAYLGLAAAIFLSVCGAFSFAAIAIAISGGPDILNASKRKKAS